MPRHESKELSKHSQYYISRDHYLELYYFCRQYYDWKSEYDSLCNVKAIDYDEHIKSTDVSDQTGDTAVKRKLLSDKMKLVDKALIETDKELATFIFKNVVSGESYKYLSSHYTVPCCEKTFYSYRRRFFWLLAKDR